MLLTFIDNIRKVLGLVLNSRWDQAINFRLLKQFFLLVCFVFLQSFFCYFWGTFSLDLVTPFLVFFIITELDQSSFLLCFFAALLLEGQSFFPFGFYFCAYLSVWLFSTGIRDYVCWENFASWFGFLMISQIWLIVFEFFSIINNTATISVVLMFLLTAISRFFFSLLVFSFLSLRGRLALSRESLL